LARPSDATTGSSNAADQLVGGVSSSGRRAGYTVRTIVTGPPETTMGLEEAQTFDLPRKGGEEAMTSILQVAQRLRNVLRDDRGQGLAEYALILALIAIISIIALIFLGSQVSDKLSVIGSSLQSVSG
jgi:pilus assembly protein Flp/PilA